MRCGSGALFGFAEVDLEVKIKAYRQESQSQYVFDLERRLFDEHGIAESHDIRDE